MKKSIALFLSVLLLLLSGCAGAPKAMTLAPATLSEKEQRAAELFVGPGKLLGFVFDFSVDEQIKSLCLSLYTLEDGKTGCPLWAAAARIPASPFTDKTGAPCPGIR